MFNVSVPTNFKIAGRACNQFLFKSYLHYKTVFSSEVAPDV